MYTQVAGKICLALTPRVNHFWNIAFRVVPHGLMTPVLAYAGRTFTMTFDLIEHRFVIETSDGTAETVPLEPRAVADFYAELMARLKELGLPVKIWTMPNEIEGAIPFDEDRVHAAYDREKANRCWRILVQAERVLTRFRAGFLGKVSPVHFFWGSFDLAVTRFSGRRAPDHPGTAPNTANWVMREAYSHEVSSAGFWPGGGTVTAPAFYAYAYPQPDGFAGAPVRPNGAGWDDELGEFLLSYDAVRRAEDPDGSLLAFLQSTYEAAADLGKWDRAALERARE